MNRIKLFAATLVLCLIGAVSAAGDNANEVMSCSMDETGASCCASGASCCDGGSCCAKHKH